MAESNREDLRRHGSAWRRKLGQSDDDAGLSAPGYRDLIDEMAYHGVWARDGLAPTDRILVTLATLCLTPTDAALRRAVEGALDLGLDARSILEVFVQAGLYGGFPLTEAATVVADGVFTDRGVPIPDGPPRDDPLEELDDRGQRIMAALHGARSASGYAAPDNPATAGLYGAAIRYGYGEIWARPGLDLRQRMLVAIACFVVLGLDSQLEKFAQSATNVGLDRSAVIEAIMQTAPYGGYPKALNALSILGDLPDGPVTDATA